MGKSYAHPLVVLVASPNELEKVRCGFVAGKNYGGAVQRNRAKRLLRAVLYPLVPGLRPGWDLIFLVRQPLKEATYQQLQAAVENLISRARLINSGMEI
ncbi:MAG: ribonuclease P protein component [Chloroflexi bacterium]|nr:ribonuclease P protein component [Chloroflexota bacterium]